MKRSRATATASGPMSWSTEETTISARAPTAMPR